MVAQLPTGENGLVGLQSTHVLGIVTLEDIIEELIGIEAYNADDFRRGDY